MLEARDLEAYVIAHDRHELENPLVDENHSLINNDTWYLVPWLQGKNVVKCQWVYNTKFTYEGTIERHKACLIVKGFLSDKASTTLKPFPQLQMWTMFN